MHTRAVDVEPDVERLRIGDFVGGHDPRADRPERVAALALIPNPTPLHLVFALADIVDDAIAGDMFCGIFWLHEHRLGANLDFPISLRRVPRQHDWVVRPAQRRDRLEHDRLSGHRQVGLGGVVSVIEADSDKLAASDERHAYPNVIMDSREGIHIQLRQLREKAERERLRCEVA